MTDSESQTPTTGFADRSIVRTILVFGIPLVLGMGFHALFNLVDLWIVGKVGTAALAAVTIASMINTIPMVICNGLSTSSIAFMARNIGFGNMHRANEVMKQSFLLIVVLSLLMGVLPFFYARDLVLLLNATGPEVINPATEYLQVMSLGTITMFLLMQITASLRAVGDGMWPMILLIGANLLNVILDVGLVFGKFGLPAMGAPGAAYATVIARGIFCVPGLIVLARGKDGLRLTLTRWKVRIRMMLQLIRVGMPASAQFVVRIIAYLAILWIIGDYDSTLRPTFGHTAQAAFGVGLRLDLFAIFSGFGWGAAASTLVGQNLGRRRPDRAAQATWVSVVLNVIMMTGIGILYFIFAPDLIRFFGADREIFDPGAAMALGGFDAVVEAGTTYLHIIVFSYVFVAVSLVLAQALNGAGSTRTPMVIDAAGLLGLQLPLAWYLSRDAGFGLAGVWYAVVISNAVIAVVYVIWFRLGHWKRKELW